MMAVVVLNIWRTYDILDTAGMRLQKVKKPLALQMKVVGELNHSWNKVCIFNKQDNFIIRDLLRDVIAFPMPISKSGQGFAC